MFFLPLKWDVTSINAFEREEKGTLQVAQAPGPAEEWFEVRQLPSGQAVDQSWRNLEVYRVLTFSIPHPPIRQRTIPTPAQTHLVRVSLQNKLKGHDSVSTD